MTNLKGQFSHTAMIINFLLYRLSSYRKQNSISDLFLRDHTIPVHPFTFIKVRRIKYII
jgi:hypothetical protein